MQSCPDGNCDMECTNDASYCQMTCDGGKCLMHCDGKSCNRQCTGGNCKLSGSGKEIDHDHPTDNDAASSTTVIHGTLFFTGLMISNFFLVFEPVTLH